MKRTIFTLILAAMCVVPGVAFGQGADDSLAVLAKDMESGAASSGLKRLGVPEFTNAAGNLGGDTGAAGKYFAERIEEYLVNNSGGDFKVIERNRLNAVLKEAKIQASGLTSENAFQELGGKINGLDGLVLGSVTRLGSKARVACKSVNLNGASNVAAKSTELSLNADMLTLFGTTVFVAADKPATEEQIVRQAQKPLRSSNNPFLSSDYEIQVVVRGVPKPLYVNGNDVYIPGSLSEEYVLRLINRTNSKVGVAVFVDGLNVIGQKRELASAALRGGNYWVVNPNNEWIIQGWQMDMRVAKKFLFVAAEESVAAKQRFNDDMGIITAAFYTEYVGHGTETGEETTRGIGTGEGSEVVSAVKRVQFRPAQTPSAILTLRYENADIVNSYAPLKK